MDEPQTYSRRHPIIEDARKLARIWNASHPDDIRDPALADAIRDLATSVAVCDKEGL